MTAGAVYFVRVSVYNDQLPGFFGFGSQYGLSITLPSPCLCDLDDDPGVNVFDLLAYLACWLPASTGAPCP